MDFGDVNILAIFICGVMHNALGFFWYGPLLGKQWVALHGWTQEQIAQQRPSPVVYLIPFGGAMVTAYILTLFISTMGMETLLGGVGVGLLAGIGFLAPFMGANYLFGQRSMPLFLIDAIYPMISLIIIGAIVGAWR